MPSHAAKLMLTTLLLSPLVCFGKEEKEDEALPIGTTNQRLKIEYQSEKKKGSRMYRVRNTANGILTPVLWKGEKETFFDVTLPRCVEKEKPCEWVESTIPTSSPTKAVTSLGYGVNQDQFVDMPEAFVRESKRASSEDRKLLPPLSTRLKGKIVGAEEKTIYVDVTVKSTAKGEDGNFLLTYEIMVGEGSSSIALYSDNKKKDYRADIPKLVWQSAESEEYTARLNRDHQMKLDEKNPKVSILLSAEKRVSVVEKKLLLMQGNKKIASVSAPAYVPGR